MAGDFIAAAGNDHRVDIPFHGDEAMRISGGNRVIRVFIANQGLARHAAVAPVAGLERRRWQGRERRHVRRHTLPDGLLGFA